MLIYDLGGKVLQNSNFTSNNKIVYNQHSKDPDRLELQKF